LHETKKAPEKDLQDLSLRLFSQVFYHPSMLSRTFPATGLAAKV